MQLQYQWQVQLELQKLNSWSIQCRVTYFFIERGEIREDGLAPTPDLPPLAICAINFSPVLDNPTQPITVHLAFLPLTFHIFSQYHNLLSPITYNLSPIPKDLPLSRGGLANRPSTCPSDHTNQSHCRNSTKGEEEGKYRDDSTKDIF
jgi:hypothetical protein